MGWDTVSVMVGIVMLLLAVGVQLATVTFKSGQNDARLKELERWRTDMRKDMHEISDRLQTISIQLSGVVTLIEERTDRRSFMRRAEGSD